MYFQDQLISNPSSLGTSTQPVLTSPLLSPISIVLPGQPVVTHLQPIDNTRWTTLLRFSALCTQFVVFLTAPLTADVGIGVYLSRPRICNELQGNLCDSTEVEGSECFSYVGCLRAERPSGLFEVPASLLPEELPTLPHLKPELMEIKVGLAVESVEYLNSLSDLPSASERRNAGTKLKIAERMAEDFYAFATSFARTLKPYYFGSMWGASGSSLTPQMIQECEDFQASIFSTMGSCDAGEFIVLPINFVNQWKERIEKKIAKDRSFLPC